jgi:hypothetical protein
MLIKSKEVDQDQVAYLRELLERDLPETTREKIERELRFLSSGAKGEKDTAYYLNFQFRDTPNWALIHDLRLEHNGRVAQIDHLLIGRMLDIYVIESKHFSSGVSINDEGEFCYFYDNKPRPIPSPIEQNNRHIVFLQNFLTEQDLLPRRLGFRLTPTFRNYVLVSPDSRLTKPKKGTYDTSMVMKTDQFVTRFNKDAEEATLADFANLAKVVSSETLRLFTRRLAQSHVPAQIDYRAKFGIAPSALTPPGQVKEEASPYRNEPAGAKGESGSEGEKTGYFCAACKKPIARKVALFCFTNKKRFSGKAYCFDCQKTAVTVEPSARTEAQ